MSNRFSKKIVIAGAAVLAAAAIGGGVAYATRADTDTPITGQARERAEAAALAHTGGGTVTETEAGDEESAYEVEVTLDDGTQVDVQLDENFDVVGSEGDGRDEED